MADIRRDSDSVELNEAPWFEFGERVIARYNVRNDGTYGGKDIGDVLVRKGEIGFVSSIGTFLQRYYIYAVDFIDSGTRVGMRGRELVSLDHLPEHVLEALGAEKISQLQQLHRGSTPNQVPTQGGHHV